MKNHLPIEVYKSIKRSVEFFLPLEPDVASIVASAIKDWAIKNGATHYIHWFQPMTGKSAGKHEGFISVKDGQVVTEFSGNCLIKGEPDASSFPNGGLRNTFEARGYSVWDCTSPAFIKDKTLYIPTAFCSYNGEALDTKTPLLKSMEILSSRALRILKVFGDEKTTSIIANVGAEQEYFLIDRKKYEERLDLKICGRTLFGADPVKGQEMDDHYCSRIRIKVLDFMNELDERLWSFGICSKTKHNEVAPAQHEMAPCFESCNVAADHNQLIMETMRVVAKKNDLACLLHEKPFSNINGSGKHVNWSLSKNDGTNLLDIGKTEKENIQFLVFLCAVIRGVSLHAGLLRMTAACAGNDRRLGGNEAPPVIVSIFLGEFLYEILEKIEKGEENFKKDLNKTFVTKINTLPNFLKDNSDRNRTSPFAFTGNKFEFRMLGSATSISFSVTVINLIVAESLEYFATILEKEKDLKKAVVEIVSKTMKEHKKIIFNGNNYSESWVDEAKDRNLYIIKDTVVAAKELIRKENLKMFEHFSVFSENECRARYKIILYNYCETISIEAHTMIEMFSKDYYPAIIGYLKELSEASLKVEKAYGIKNKSLLKEVEFISNSIDKIDEQREKLKSSLKKVKNIEAIEEKAEFSRDVIIPSMDSLRSYVDDLEQVLPRNFLKIPTITDILHKV